MIKFMIFFNDSWFDRQLYIIFYIDFLIIIFEIV